jgi:hypothetical protein
MDFLQKAGFKDIKVEMLRDTVNSSPTDLLIVARAVKT